MSFQRDFYPILRSMQICGLYPTAQILCGHMYVPSLWHHAYPIVMCLLCWINGCRQISQFVYMPTPVHLSNILYAMMMSGYYLMCAIIRTTYVVANLRGNRWLQQLQLLADDEDERFATPVYEYMKSSKVCANVRRRVFIAIQCVCWFYIVFNNTFITVLALTKKEYFGSAMSPFIQAASHDWQYQLSVGMVIILSFTSDSAAIFGNGFICCITLEYAGRFNILRQWLVEQGDMISDGQSDTKSTVSDNSLLIRANNRVAAAGFTPQQQRGNTSPVDINTGSPIRMASSPPPTTIDIESIRKVHFYLMTCVKKLDRLARPTIGVSMALGFFGLLINLYQMVWGTNDVLLRTIWISWVTVCLVFLVAHIFCSAFLNKHAQRLHKCLFRFPSRYFFSDTNPNNGFQLMLLLGQCNAPEPIALTFFDVLSLKNETIMALFGTVMTYFLIMVDYTAGEKRGMLDNADSAFNESLALADGIETTMRSSQ